MARINTIEEAVVLAERFMRDMDGTGAAMKLFRDLTQQRDFGWVFFFGPDNPEILVGGNAPLIVARNDGAIHTTGTAYTVKFWMQTGPVDIPHAR